MRDIREIASILDEDIKKSLAPRRSVAQFEKQIRESIDEGEDLTKSITYNPLEPADMGLNRHSYYSPYRRLSDGSFAPHSVEHWAEQGKEPGDYNDVHRFLSEAGYYTKKAQDCTNRLRDLVKGGVANVGEIREWKGVKWQKVSQTPSHWAPVSEDHQHMASKDAPGTGMHLDLDKHHARMGGIEAELKSRKQHKDTKEAAKKEALDHVSKVMSKMGGEHAKAFDEHRKNVEGEDKESQKKERLDEKQKKTGASLEEKLARRKSGEGEKVELTRDELTKVLENGKYALISAGSNPNHEKEKDMDPNDPIFEKRYGELEGELKKSGLTYTDVTGKYEGGKEKTYLVMAHNHDDEHIMAMGRRFNQDSVILAEGGKQKQVFTSGEHEGYFNEGEGHKEEANAKDNYTEVETEDGHVFKFNLGLNFDNFKKIEPKAKSKKLKASGDEGRPDNKMSGPEFIAPGREVNKENVENFLGRFHKDFAGSTNMDNDVMAAGATHFASRLKDPSSLLNKMNGRLKDRSLNTVTDAIGARAMAGNLADQKKIMDKMKSKYDIVEYDDFADSGRADGYRAIHVLFRTKSGRIGELQVKTHNQQAWAGYTHDNIYKGHPEIKDNEEVKKYTIDLSNHLSGIDKGGHDDVESRPEYPAALKKAGIPEFDYSQLHQDVPKAPEKEGVKFYVAKRDANKKNLGTKEFNSFDEAKDHADTLRSKGHEGELPIGYARDQNSFHFTFNEYAPSGKMAKKKGKR
jgi:ppGpp synthetase/RelA/SpoT-type nucleotidyltranferase